MSYETRCGCSLRRLLFAIILVVVLLMMIYSRFYNYGTIMKYWSESQLNAYFSAIDTSTPVEVNLAVVACGQKRNVLVNMLILIKSAILFSKGVHLKVFVFIDDETDLDQEETIDTKLQKYSMIAKHLGLHFEYEIVNSWFPQSSDVDWRNMYMSCTTQRLFLPSVLADTDAVLYLDADTIFVSSVKQVWNIFRQMNSEQVVGMINEHEPPADGYYNVLSKIPYYGPRGVNGGVVFMNLTRLRKVGFEKEIHKIYNKYQDLLKYADQDLMNIYFNKNPKRMYNVSCAFNFRKGHCICDRPNTGSCRCRDAEKFGMAIIHGNIWGFSKPPLEIIYNLFWEFNLATENPSKLFKSIRYQLYQEYQEENQEDNTCLDPTTTAKLLSRFKDYLH